ncbi:hypothetical protein [Colwellia sp. PAMC 21821]|uniref:hypothetical protein n=1 Tax=Colwellia sp. PAMC 21821 TaxID=1816219 RepID=UPI0009BDA774|nr:hypothetical protein [Colwellia sp. PAMC 21821]ARD46405.1 hypothetical protein A3Q33_20240 [Colwellia sp. PAMC 21821]
MGQEFQNQFCYVSTPEHQGTFFGKYIYIYADKGQLSLTSDGLEYVGEKSNYRITRSSIRNIELSQYSRVAKPFKLNFIKITYVVNSIENTIFLTPTSSSFTPIYKTNLLVGNWLSKLMENMPAEQNT